MSGMAEVLAAHPGLYGAYEWKCLGCRGDVGKLADGSGPQLLAAHQAAALSAAGFGPVKEAQADAWDEGHNHCFHVEDPRNPDRNPYRAAAVRGEG